MGYGQCNRSVSRQPVPFRTGTSHLATEQAGDWPRVPVDVVEPASGVVVVPDEEQVGLIEEALGPPPTTTTSSRSGTSRRHMGPAPKQVASVSPDRLGDAVREAHDRQVGVDLERVGKQARVPDPEPGEAV